MIKLITTLIVVIISIFTLDAQNFGKGTSLEIDFNNTYRVYKVFNSSEEYLVAKKLLINLLYEEGLIDSKGFETNEINNKKTENNEIVYRFTLNKEKMNLKLNKKMLTTSKFNNLKNGISKIYKHLKSEKHRVSKTTTKTTSKEKSNSKSHTSSTTISYSVNIDIDNSNGNYKLLAKYNEDGQYEKLINLISEELGSKNLKKYSSHYQWSKKVAGGYAYLISVYKGKFKVVIENEFSETKLFSKIKNIAEVGKVIINPNLPKPPKTPATH